MTGRWLASVVVFAACAGSGSGDDRDQRSGDPATPRPAGGPTTLPVVEPESSVTVTLLAAGAEPRQPLRFRPVVGTEQTLVIETKTDVAMSMGEHPMFSRSDTAKGRIRVRATAIRGEHIDFELTVIDMETPTYDPTDFKPAPRLAGATGTFTITDRGVLVSQHLPFLASEEARAALHLPDYLFVLPGEPVGIGAKWEVKSVQLRNDIGTLAIDTHELVAFDGASGRTTSKLVFDSWPQIVTFPQDPITMFEVLTFRSTGSGATQFDVARAMPVGNKTEFEFSTEMAIRRPEMKQKIDMTMAATIATTDEGHGGRPR